MINEIAKDKHKDYRWIIINSKDVNIIKFTTKGFFEIFDKNFRLWLRFSDLNLHPGRLVYLTKYFIIINVICDINRWSKVIKRKLRSDYDKLQS